LVVLAAGPAVVDAGGLAVSPLRFEGRPTPGAPGVLHITNGSGQIVRVTVTPRRWRQLSDGEIVPDVSPPGTLRSVAVSDRLFRLQPGERRSVSLALRGRAPEYLYATVLTRVTVPGRPGGGIRSAQEIASTIHLSPPQGKRRFALDFGRPRAAAVGRRGRVTISVPVRNVGNMVSDVGGFVVVHGPGGIRNLTIAPRPLLPGSTVALGERVPGRLRPGRYRVTAWIARPGSAGGAKRAARGSFRITRAGRLRQ